VPEAAELADQIVLGQRLGSAFAERCVHVARIIPQRAIGLGDRSRHVDSLRS
jgi:hypothetical protein